MRKALLFALVLLFVAAFLPAQQTTWISPWTNLYPFLPQSMLSFVTSGLFYDELDIVIRSPGELSNYDGYTFYTMYGNIESWFWATPISAQSAVGPVNPFTTNLLAQGAANDFNSFLFGAAFPFLSFRMGAAGGFVMTQTGNIAGDHTYERTNLDIVDADADAVEDSRTNTTDNYTDSENGTVARFGAGVDLGFIAVSAFGDFTSNARRLGGTYGYAYTPGEVAAVGPNYLTAANMRYGPDHAGEGKTKGYPVASDNSIGAIAEIVLPLGIELPIVAGATMNTEDLGLVTANTPQYASFTEGEPYAGAAATETAALTLTRGTATNNYPTESATLQAGLGALYAEIPAGEGAPALLANAAPDLENAKNNTFGLEVHGRVDPEMPIGDLGSLRLRGGANYKLESTNTNDATTRSMSYTGFDAVGNAVTYSWSEAVNAPSSTSVNTTGLEVGGVFDFSAPSGIIDVAAGFIFNPEVKITTTENEAQTTVTNVSFTTADAAATEAAAWADVLGTGTNIEGSRTTTATTPAATASKVTVTTNRFNIPVATRVNLAEGKFQIINGYLLEMNTTKTKTVTPDQPAAVLDTGSISNSAGTQVDTAPTTTSIDTVSDVLESTTTSETATNWSGVMNFMLRWMPFPELTLDFFGQTIINALNFELFPGSAASGPNFSTIINALGISATINIK